MRIFLVGWKRFAAGAMAMGGVGKAELFGGSLFSATISVECSDTMPVRWLRSDPARLRECGSRPVPALACNPRAHPRPPGYVAGELAQWLQDSRRADLLAMSFLLLPVLPNRGQSVEDHQSSSDMTFAIITIMRWVQSLGYRREMASRTRVTRLSSK
jgi:hypothetical protein